MEMFLRSSFNGTHMALRGDVLWHKTAVRGGLLKSGCQGIQNSVCKFKDAHSPAQVGKETGTSTKGGIRLEHQGAACNSLHWGLHIGVKWHR